MSPFFHHKDPLAQAPLQDPIAADALVVRGDPGYSAMTWWKAGLSLQVSAPGREPALVEHECKAMREKPPLTGLTLPVEVEREDPTQLRIRWEEVPTVEERIASRDPLVFDPESGWHAVLGVDPSQVERKPAWGDGRVPGWPPAAELKQGRRAGTALVIAHSWDPDPYLFGENFVPPSPDDYSYGGTLKTTWHGFLSWLLLRVIPPDGDEYGLQVQTVVQRDHLAPVLPVAINPSKPADVEIVWDEAPVVRTDRQAANQRTQELAAEATPIRPEQAEEMAAQIDNPLARRAIKRMARSGKVAIVATGAQPGGPPAGDLAEQLAQLQEMRARGELTNEEFEAATAKLTP